MVALRKAGFTGKFDKREIGRSKIEYLGHWVGSGILAVPKHRTFTMMNLAKPRTQKLLESFLGSMHYTENLFLVMPDCWPSFLQPLQSTHQALYSGPRTWSLLSVNVLCDVTVLHVPLLEDVFSLHTDASGDGIGAILNMVRDEGELPVSLYSRQLPGAEANDSVMELETIASYPQLETIASYPQLNILIVIYGEDNSKYLLIINLAYLLCAVEY